MATYKQVMAHLRKQRGPAARLTETPGAPTRREREKLQEEIKSLRERVTELRARKSEILRTDIWRRLSDAVDFVCDTDGDPDAVAALRQVRDEAAEYWQVQDEFSEALDRSKKLTSRAHLDRWRVSVPQGLFNMIIAHGDTLEQVLDQLTRKTY